MSETETIKGKVKRIKTFKNNVDKEQWCKEYCIKNNISLNYGKYVYNTYLELLLDTNNFRDDYVIINNQLYQYLEKQHLDNNYFCKITKQSDDTFEFITQFYNGGTTLEELLQNCKELK